MHHGKATRRSRLFLDLAFFFLRGRGERVGKQVVSKIISRCIKINLGKLKYDVNKRNNSVKMCKQFTKDFWGVSNWLFSVIVFVNIFTREQDIKIGVIFLKNIFQILKKSCWVNSPLCHPGTDTLTSISWPI